MTTPQIQHDPVPQVLQRGIATVSRLYLAAYTASGTAIAATGTYLLEQSGSTVTSGTVSSSSGYTAAYSVTVPTTYALGGGYIETWTLTGTDSPIIREVFVCRSEFRSTVIESDLARHWRDRFIDTAHPVDWYLQKSWEACWRKIYNQGRYPFLSMAPSQFTDAQMCWIYATGFDSSPAYADQAKDWWDRWAQAWKNMVWTEADSDDGDTPTAIGTASQPGIATAAASKRWGR